MRFLSDATRPAPRFVALQTLLIAALVAEQNAKHLLEQTVVGRTADLRRAMADLDRTQTDLVQAAKLLGLGQMFAALSHEFNQPLAAVKTYADNARSFLGRNRTAEAVDNIERISKMADRMASISAHLRNFARRPQQAIGPVLLNGVVQDATCVVEVRNASAGGRISYAPPPEEIWVTGGPIRLQQVMVNLINNALDAMEGQSDPVVDIATTEAPAGTSAGIALRVRAAGADLDPTTTARRFDPFFTTKPSGKGLGLVLSISYKIITDFGGQLTAANTQGGGAVFCVVLLPAPPPQRAQMAAQ